MSKATTIAAISVPLVLVIAFIGYISVTVKPMKTSKNQDASGSSTPTSPVAIIQPIAGSPQAPANTTLTTTAALVPKLTNPRTSTTKSASATFNVPEGNTDKLSITITSDESGLITGATFAQENSTRESSQYSTRFNTAYKSLIIGKKITDISLSRVGGASLTTGAFNKALANLN